MHRPRIILATLLAVAALVVTASVTVASPAGLNLAAGKAAVAAGAGLAQAASVTATLVGAGSQASSSEALADAWAAASAGLDKAVDALNSNSTDADAGGLDGISTARDAIAAGLAHAGDAADNAANHGPGN